MDQLPQGVRWGRSHGIIMLKLLLGDVWVVSSDSMVLALQPVTSPGVHSVDDFLLQLADLLVDGQSICLVWDGLCADFPWTVVQQL